MEKLSNNDDGQATQLSFQMWTDQMQESLDSEQKAMLHFSIKILQLQFSNSMNMDQRYLQNCTRVKRSLSYLTNDMLQEALSDAMQAQVISPVCHIVSYLQAATLFALKMETEAHVALKEGF